jgi:hypothetical protein
VSCVEERLAALAPHRGFDPEGLGLAEKLAARGLTERCELRLALLERQLTEAQRELAALLDELDREGASREEPLVAAIERGDLRQAIRLARRVKGRLDRPSDRTATRWALSLYARAREQTLPLPDELRFRLAALERGADPTARFKAGELAHELSQALFGESMAVSRATVAMARATDNVPEVSGPYNPQSVAARALAELAVLAPAYARALVASLDDLSVLDAAVQPALPKVSRRRRS